MESGRVPLFDFVGRVKIRSCKNMSSVGDIIFDVKELLEPLLLDRSLELCDIELKGRNKKKLLRIFIDKEGGVTIDDCAAVSRDLGTLLDVHDIMPDSSYTLEISSPGVTRALKKPSDYVRFRGKKVKIETDTLIKDKGVFVGILGGFSDDVVSVEIEEVTYLIPYDQIRRANLELDF